MEKYLKYKFKYLSLAGASAVVAPTSEKEEKLIGYTERFEKEGFKIVQNYGQHNCGIFINNESKRLIKCENGVAAREKIALSNTIEPRVFPEVYKTIEDDGLLFVEMQLLDMDH